MKVRVLKSNELIRVEEALDVRGGFHSAMMDECVCNCTSGNTNNQPTVPIVPCPKNVSCTINCSSNCSPDCKENAPTTCNSNCIGNKNG